MLQLSFEGIKNKAGWEQAGILLPQYDLTQVNQNTMQNPKWIHFGAGNIYRAFIAALQQELLDKGKADCGIAAVETYDQEIIDKIYTPYDNLALTAMMMPDGSLVKRVVSAGASAYFADAAHVETYQQLKEMFRNKDLELVSYTITEKGYAVMDMQQQFIKPVLEDIEAGPDAPKHVMSMSAAMLYERFLNGAHPAAVVSMDNCSHNGDMLKESILTVAGAWAFRGYVPSEFISYLKDTAKVSFPLTMIDKITPRPSVEVFEKLKSMGIAGMDPIVTEKKTYIAPYVNAEFPQYLVMEDNFPNGRPALEAAGVYFTDRSTVNLVETMKVTTCLNPLHTALAVFGCILGYQSIADEMQNPDLVRLISHIGYVEGMAVVTDPGIIHPKQFLDEVMLQRLPNPYIPDTPQRIATDTSQKIFVRFGRTMKAYMEREELEPGMLTAIPLVLAGWLRYLLGIGDDGHPFERSPDPMLLQMDGILSGIEFGNPQSLQGQIDELLRNEAVFGVDLFAAGLASKVKQLFGKMLGGVHAVEEILREMEY